MSGWPSGFVLFGLPVFHFLWFASISYHFLTSPLAIMHGSLLCIVIRIFAIVVSCLRLELFCVLRWLNHERPLYSFSLSHTVIDGRYCVHHQCNNQGCRICGSVGALLPGTFYFARHFLLKDEKWWQVAGGSKVYFLARHFSRKYLKCLGKCGNK